MSTPRKKPAQQEKKPSQAAGQRRYPPDLKERAVGMVQQLRKEDPADQGVISRVSRQLGVGTESLRTWVKQSDIDAGARPGVTTDEQAKLAELEREIKELKRANEILQAAAIFMQRPSSTADGRSSQLRRGEPVPVRGRADLRFAAVRPLHLLRQPVPSALSALTR